MLHNTRYFGGLKRITDDILNLTSLILSRDALFFFFGKRDALFCTMRYSYKTSTYEITSLRNFCSNSNQVYYIRILIQQELISFGVGPTLPSTQSSPNKKWSFEKYFRFIRKTHQTYKFNLESLTIRNGTTHER